ncbi:MAG: polysaccharide deacetylase family protein [Candidatus Zixiibacteriota bacterium]
MAILTFHNTDTSRQIGFNNYHPNRLRRILEGLLEAGYELLSMDEYLGNRDNRKNICLSFDDGYESFFNYAFPVLKELNLKAIVFVPAAYIGRRADWDYTGKLLNTMHLNERQIAEIADSGIEIGSHGSSHTDLTSMSERGLKVELEHSKSKLEQLTALPVNYISYPFGRFNGEVEMWAAQYGYKNGFSLSYFKKSKYGFTIPRSAVYSTDTMLSILATINGGFPGSVEKLKRAIMNAYASGTIWLNKIRSRNINFQV